MVKVFVSLELEEKKNILIDAGFELTDDVGESQVALQLGIESEISSSKYYVIDLGDTIFESVHEKYFHLGPCDNQVLINMIDFLSDEIEDSSHIMRNALRFEQKILKGASRFIKGETVTEDFLMLYYDFIILANESLQCENIMDLMAKINDIFNDRGMIDRIQYIKSGHNGSSLIALADDDYIEILFNKEDDQSYFFSCLMIEIIDNYYQRELHLKSEVNLWEEAFNMISPPAAMLTMGGELLIHNPKFMKLKLLPTKCMEFRNNERIEVEDIIYKVERIEAEYECQKFLFFMFIDELESTEVKNISTQELGVISSSVAHELKNPLAGVIAAVSVLQLEDSFDDETKNSLEEMKRGGQRCKDLVEIFLGFSKKDLAGRGSFVFFKAFQQALNLLRFRMVEKNVRIDVNKTTDIEPFSREVNTSVASMIFYLVLSEVITDFAHFSLVSESERRVEKIYVAEFCQNRDCVELIFDASINFELRLQRSKLVDHLLKMENLYLKVKKGTIIIGALNA